MKKIVFLLFHRSFTVGMSLLLQVLTIVFVVGQFSMYREVFYWGFIILSMLVTLWILSTPGEPAYKIAWMILILPFPIFGGVFYLMVGGTRVSTRTRDKMRSIAQKSIDTLYADFKAEDLVVLGEDAAGQARYMEQRADSPAYTNTDVEYYGLGELAFKSMLEELKKAEKYIFLEYFIIQPGEMWDEMLAILTEKAAKGVEVRVLYDDIGCMFTLPRNYPEQMAERGIQCQVFNRFIPVMSLRLNNRDHRKIMVIDGKIGFTGGMNLADEYINRREKHGHWKDSALMLAGDGVWSMAVTFLSMWGYASDWKEDFEQFRPAPTEARPWTGYVQPYNDTPLDDETVSQTVYLNMIGRARKYIYITTPYLIIDVATNTALCNAAKSGVDVRIITPNIPDKRCVQEVTRAHYPPLQRAGVKIYEYTPGFIHAKNFVVDGKYATVGTVNMDYRSLFLHFENGVWLCEAPCIHDIVEDFKEAVSVCLEISPRRERRLSVFGRIYRSILRIFAPLM